MSRGSCKPPFFLSLANDQSTSDANTDVKVDDDNDKVK